VKNGTDLKVFDVLERLAAMSSHIPNQGEQMVRYYGCTATSPRGKRQNESEHDDIPCIIESDRSLGGMPVRSAQMCFKITSGHAK
jgi:hypothetical protein